MNVTVYTSPGCMPCRATKRALDNAKVPYTTIDVTEDTEAAADLKRLGYTATPVVVAKLSAGTEHWSGYSPDRIKHLRRELDAIEYLAEGGGPA